MNDRELLELAAKAAGFEFAGKLIPEVQGKRKGPFILKGSRWTQWNPLTDDGDALRLAVSLRLSPMMRTLGCDTTDLNGTAGAYEKWGGDPYAATRRAIVRAAAEIGRQMEVA